jgi:hypothetical protein
MNKKLLQSINNIKLFLKMDVKLEQTKLVDGVTIIEADMFEADSAVSIVNGEELIPLTVGEYELEDGRILVVVEEGVISEIKESIVEEEVVEEVESVVEAEIETPKQQTTAKKVVKTITEEQHFAEVTELKKTITELESKLTELSVVEEVVEVVEEVVELKEVVKPIVFNPENKKKSDTPETPLEKFRAVKANMKNFAN